jgi:hypothetical protein
MRRLLVIAATAILIGGVTYLANAAIPSADGTFTACIAKANGTVRIIDTAVTTSCKSTEIQRTWTSAPANAVSAPVMREVQGQQTVGNNFFVTFHADCLDGTVATGGGGRGTQTIPGIGGAVMDIVHSFPQDVDSDGFADRWSVTYESFNGEAFLAGGFAQSSTYVICAEVVS